jgi:hypothetical protein
MISPFHFWAIHVMVLLSLLALAGYLKTGKKCLIFFSVLSFFGALCFVFVALFEALGK